MPPWISCNGLTPFHLSYILREIKTLFYLLCAFPKNSLIADVVQ
jgi:hypothetical protein